MLTDSSSQLTLVRGAVAVCLGAFWGAGQALAAVSAENVNVASNAARDAAHHAYLGTGLISSAPWLVNNTPETVVFTLFGVGFIGLALLGRKKLVRR